MSDDMQTDEYMTASEIEEALISAYVEIFGHTHQSGYDTVHFSEALGSWAEDCDHPLSAFASSYLSLPKEYRVEIVVPVPENAVVGGHPEVSYRSFVPQ